MNLKNYLTERKGLIDQALETYLPEIKGNGARVVQAMRYSLMAGGKRLRPILCLAAAEAVDGQAADVLPVACALEMIHTYSLIHDDLPAMDDDDLRRGQPTCHKQFDEATAVLAGDGLLTEAFVTMSRIPETFVGREAICLEVINLIAQAAGCRGMVGGQMADLLAEGQKLGLPQVEAIHRLKTGALLTAAVRAGALLGGGTPEAVERLTRYGQKFGLIFQITDDLLDVEGQASEMGKAPGMDLLRQKATYPGILGVETAKVQARELIEQAEIDLSTFGPQAEPLRELVRYLLIRRN
ncbi:MAG: polyprenyl synthetase family protein [Desulfobacteraceae bacterium]